jgi:mRNA interferase MazF
MLCETFDVAVVPFPFMDKPAIKRRPALALSQKDFNNANGHTVFAMITTAKLDQWQDDYFLADTVTPGLVQDCFVRWKLFTLPNEMVLKKLGSLGTVDCDAVSRILRRILPFG